MADKFDDDKDAKPLRDLTSDSGLGNLPPLSDFDSQAGTAFDSGGALPPLGNFGSGPGSGGGITPSEGDLSAISDLDVETPGAPDLYSSGGAVTTPSSPTPSHGFQDLAADSDFSPETPEIGPGPDSNLDTPMFDSAFGGGSTFDRNMRASLDTPAPTQAMETPLFGESAAPRRGAGGGFDDGGFDLGGPMGGGFGGGFDAGAPVGGGFNMGGGGGLEFDAGTPAPDFSPDTGMRQPPTGGDARGARGGGGGKSNAVVAMVAVAALLIGLVLGPLAIGAYLPGVINPTLAAKEAAEAETAQTKQQLQAANKRASEAETELQKYRQVGESPEGPVNLTEEIRKQQAELDAVNAELESKTVDLQAIERDIVAQNEQFIQAQQLFEDLKNETAITQARQKGLLAEIERLSTYTGELEEANQRRIQSRDALAHSVDRLIIQLKESIPLTPEKYNHAERVATAQALRDQLEASNWVSPEIQDAYTKLYLRELEIAQGNEYFFAKLRVTDELGNKTFKWAEALMQGNWSVLYRSLDGKNIGEFTNIAPPGEPVVWGYREALPQDVRAQIEQKIFANRVPDFEEKIAVIAQKQLAAEEGTSVQRTFDSL